MGMISKHSLTAKGNEPLIFLEGEYNMDDIAAFRQRNEILKERDIFELQLREYFKISNPKSQLVGDLEKRFSSYHQEHLLNIKPNPAGSWVYYPWTKYLYRVVGPAMYYALRTNRNRNLITLEEQDILSSAKILSIGLSVGSSIITNLVYGGIGGAYTIVDNDVIEATNLNRIFGAGLPDIGVRKSETLSHFLYNIDPFLDIQQVDDAVDEKNIRNFFSEEGKPSIIFEVIDSFYMKLMLREHAKRSGIPVIMVTNLGDRIIIDVERYDLHKDTRFFNGRADDVVDCIKHFPDTSSEELGNLYAVKLAGLSNIPLRAAQSVEEIGNTLVGRPQLASTVAVSGAFCAYITRKILLGDSISGSWLVDFDKIFLGENSISLIA